MDLSVYNNEQNCTSQNCTVTESYGNNDATDENFVSWNKGTNQTDIPTTISGNLKKKIYN